MSEVRLGGIFASTIRSTLFQTNLTTSLSALFMIGVLQVAYLPGAAIAGEQSCDSSQVAGVVFRDFNYNGTPDFNEPGEANIVIKAYDGNNSEVDSTSSDTDGRYVLNVGSTAVRVEFQNIPNYLAPGPKGQSSVTTLSFPNAGDCNLNLAVVSPGQYCDSDPYLATPRYVNGESTAPAISRKASLFAFQYGNTGEPLDGNGPLPNAIALDGQIASTWGIAYQRSTKTVFASAVLKRHSDLGPLGTGGIYSITPADSLTPTVSNFIDLSTLGINTGVDPRVLSGELLATQVSEPSFDVAAFSQVGKVGLGGMAMSEDDKTIYVMNLFDRTLYALHVGNPAVAPSLSDVSPYPVPNPGCSNNEYVPWAVNIHEGSVYVGVTCTAETSRQASDLHAYVLKLKGNAFETIFDFALDYQKGYGIHPGLLSITDAGLNWKPWARDFNDVTTNNNFGFAFIIYPQAILSALAWENDGSLYVGLADRSGHQYGPWNFAPESDHINFVNGPSSGDTLLACKIGQDIDGDYIYELENNSACTGHGPTAGANQSPAQGPGGGEFFYEDRYNPQGILGLPANDTHQETTFGAMTKLFGTDELKLNSYDLNEYEDGGVRTFDTISGGFLEHYQIYQQNDVDETIPGTSFGKAIGLGDLEILCDPAPIEIGNRVWLDGNENGVQDVGEDNLVGVTVRLIKQSDSTVVATTVTDADGTYYFRSSDGVEPSTSYRICLNEAGDFSASGALNGLGLTTKDSGSDINDSDAALTGEFPCIELTTGEIGQNDHSFDFGLIQTQCVEKDLFGINGSLDGTSQALFDLEKKALKHRTNLENQGRCKKLSAKKKKALLSESSELHMQTWTEVWSNGNSVSVCDQNPIVGCTSVSMSSSIETMSNNFDRIRDIVHETLSCKKISKKGVNFKKQADTYVVDAESDLDELRELGNTAQCQ